VIPACLVLPPGRCLTDVWPHLPLRLKVRWLLVVEQEGRAVRKEAAAARRHQAIILLPADAAARKRREVLEMEAATFRVGQPRKRPVSAAGTPRHEAAS
jgi:hypothetical protein